MVKTQAEFNISKINIANDQLQKKLQEEIQNRQRETVEKTIAKLPIRCPNVEEAFDYFMNSY